jgi:undecaprenyl diphosphate synthase
MNKTLPKHVAIIMDGNGRWAKKRFLPRAAGHKVGVDALRGCIESAREIGLEQVTVFAFSSENWQRPEDEVSAIMQIFAQALVREAPQLAKNGVRLRFIGERTRLAPDIQKAMQDAEAITAHNHSLIFNVAMNYGGRWDIAQAATRAIAAGVNILEPGALEPYLDLAGEPDLLIRTGGEYRVSNFLLWQMAYTELYFTDTLWPDFDRSSIDAALAFYAQRERRFGKTSEQVAA